MIGRVLGGRYEILERVGGGGMAIVYRALDTFLNRPVAVKVLRPQFAADEELVARFRREARAAASLSDPRIVSVFDVGQDGDVYYIVMEYVDGSTLKRRIQEDGPFAPDAAAEVAKHILIALEHAHRAGIVHRDVKPQNVILTRDGRVKVTDFGIAQAAGGATLVHTDSILGTAHYLSPEQAKGRPADERSDVYATGIVLYEMLAGRPPFEGDSPLAVAMQHLQAEPPSLTDFRDDVPEDLLYIVSRATAKEPVRRYASAEMFRRDLDAFLAGRPLPSRTEGEEPDEGATVALPSGFRAASLDPRVPADAAAARAARPAGAGEDSGPDGGGRDRRGGEGGRGAGGGGAQAGGARGRGRRRARWAVLAVVLAVLAAAAGYGVSRWLAVPEVPVPSVQNLPLDKAQQKLKQAGLSWIIGPAQYSSTVPSTYVASQDPAPGTVVKATHPVTLYLSKGPEYVEGGVPDLKGRPQRDAEIALKNARLKARVTPEYDDTVPKGYVIRTNPPAGDSIRVGDTVELIVSDGPAPRPITMPDLRGMTLGQAQALLEQLGLAVSSTQTKKSSYPEDIVADQTPAPNAQVQAGDSVTLTISSGCEHSAPVSVTPDPQRYDQPVGVRAVVTDSAGDHIDFQDTVQPGESVPIQACWAGDSATLNVYFNDQLVERVELH